MKHPDSARLHPCARQMKDFFDGMRVDGRGALLSRGKSGLVRMAVWPDTLERAIRFLSQFCFAAEAAGHEISFGKRLERRAALIVGRERIPFTLNEKYRRQSRTISDEEREELSPYHRATGSGRHHTYVPLKSLELKIEGVWIEGEKGIVRDKPDLPVEKQIASIMAMVEWQASELKKFQIEQDRAKTLAAQREERRVAALDLKKREDDRLALLLEVKEAFDDAERFAVFVAHLEQTITGSASPEVAAFLAWANAYLLDMRAACSLPRIEKDVAWSGLFK